MRATLAIAAALSVAACTPTGFQENWTCDFDASESRPAADQDASADDAGLLSVSECQDTCGPPATRCTATTLDGGRLGAVCPVCTF